MGINFYLEHNKCNCCGRCDRLHIGKSSHGWTFTLHVMPEEGINNLDDWKKLWEQPGAVIVDEDGTTLIPEEMLERITNRGKPAHELMRNNPDHWCLGRGGPTWDLVMGEFS